MIHQLIFASPKPGLSERAFQDYWKQVHAVKYASKIPQIKQYCINSRIPFGPEATEPFCGGIAEIWLENEQEQLASLQSKEFLEGARVDEPRWAAFWRTVVLDTNAHVLREGDGLTRDSTRVKLFMLAKRKRGMPLEEFRRYSLQVHASLALKIPGLQRYVQCHVQDSFYTVGEALLDSVSMAWFDDLDTLQRAMDSPGFQAVKVDAPNYAESRYVHMFATDEYWVIGPYGYA